MKLSNPDELEFARLFTLKHGYGPEHASLKSSSWNISVWNNEDIASIVSNPRSVNRELDKIWNEQVETERNTVVNPILSEYNSVGLPAPILHPKPLFDEKTFNILTNLGMKNMGQLSTAESTKTNVNCNVGDDNTAELVGDDQLGNFLKAKVFDTDGDRETVDQQERYAMAFFRSDFASDVTLREAEIATGPTTPTDIQIVHVTFADKPIGAGQTMTVQITVTHKNGTS